MSTQDVVARPRIVRFSPEILLLAILVLIFSVAAGFGWFGESRDHLDYVSGYDAINLYHPLQGSRFEPAFLLSAWIAKAILDLNFGAFYTVLTALSLGLKFHLLWKYASAPILAAIVYLMLLYPLHEYTQIRAAVGLAFAYTAVAEFLEGRRIIALFMMIVGALFHYSTAVIACGGALALFTVSRPAFVGMTVYASTAAVSSITVSKGLKILIHLNPLISVYVKQTYLNKVPTLLSGENILLVLLTICSAIFLRPWQFRKDGVFFAMSFWMLTFYVAFIQIPVVAHRIAEAFIFSYFLFVFRFDDYHQSRIPAAILVLAGGWMFYEAIAQKLISL